MFSYYCEIEEFEYHGIQQSKDMKIKRRDVGLEITNLFRSIFKLMGANKAWEMGGSLTRKPLLQQ